MPITVPYTFKLHPATPATAVNVAGTFNNWNKDASPMQLGTDGTWTVTVPLAPGKYQYKFVLNHDAWITDPKGTTIDDGNGNANSSLVILPIGYDQPALRNDGKITASALHHSTTVPDFNFDQGRLTISLDVRPGDISRVEAVVNGKAYRMEPVAEDEISQRLRAEIPWDRKTDLHYAFRLDDGDIQYFGPKGLTESESGNDFTVEAKTYHPFLVPDWVQRSVFYQIFPDRFANGDKTNDPANVTPWDGKPTYSNKMGGDFAGVSQHIDYLRSLSVGAIYFNPIFWSPSNHRYETIDYYRVDPELGTNDQFIGLTHDLTKAGIRTVLDGVFNHTAPAFFAFHDVVEKGAASPYTSWYWFKSFPVHVGENPNYEAWYNYPSMPKLNVLNPATSDYLLKVPQYWQQHADIAGWRLDTANEVAMDYWRKFRTAVKSTDPNAWIVGEMWGDASPWLGGDQWDATMNYQFREAVLGLVATGHSGKPSECLNRLMHTYALYAPQVSRNLMNLIGSHDTPRILSMCGGDPDLAKLAAVIEFTWVGAPTIYYGDELGMDGGADPENRRPMRWDLATPQNDFLHLYQTLASLRKQSPVLQSGEPFILQADDATGVGVYGRRLDDQMAVVAFNRSNHAQTATFTLPLAFRHQQFSNALTGDALAADAKGAISIQLAPRRAAILMPLSGSTPRPRLSSRVSDSDWAPSTYPRAQEHIR